MRPIEQPGRTPRAAPTLGSGLVLFAPIRLKTNPLIIKPKPNTKYLPMSMRKLPTSQQQQPRGNKCNHKPAIIFLFKLRNPLVNLLIVFILHPTVL